MDISTPRSFLSTTIWLRGHFYRPACENGQDYVTKYEFLLWWQQPVQSVFLGHVIRKLVDSCVCQFYHPSWTRRKLSRFSTKEGLNLVQHSWCKGITMMGSVLYLHIWVALEKCCLIHRYHLFSSLGNISMRYGNAHYSGSNAVKVNITIRLATDRRSFAKFSPTVENYSLRMCAFF